MYWILLLLYSLLLLLYAWQYPSPTLSKWPLLMADDSTTPTVRCQDTHDCDAHHICLNQTCLPQLLRGEECDPLTGDWTLVSIQGKSLVACICKYPDFIHQKHYGGNCDVDVTCQPYGHYNVHTKQCDCLEGFVPLNQPKPKCQKLPVVERMMYRSCDSDEVHFSDIQPSDGFTAGYLRRHQNKKCFKRPCTFDAFTSQPLKKARYEKGIGCVCDPALGQFGVRIEGLSDYVRGPGYNACASVFQTPLEKPIPVQVVTYFYLMQQPAVSFLQYDNIQASQVIAPLSSFIQGGTLQVGQEFPYDYMQAFFRQRHPFTAQVRQFNFNETFYAKYPPTFTRKPNQMEWCRFMSRHLKDNFLPSEWAFNLLYTFPACYIGKKDQDAPEPFRGRYVSNPLHFTYGAYGEHPRYNGLRLKHERGDWTLDFAPEYDIDTYRSLATPQMVPFLDDPVVKMLEQGYMSNDPIDEQNALYRREKRDRDSDNEPTF
ncbi:uncharacterized protein TNCT_316291 [Trichonephila clavata]|uniref:Uncharacterized protein n=2 Tax=Trichonephila clavata TaxID=2740835 RepID=A0A8X6GTC4_TRICU|nr:uncharacterized protein TNCT_316291 [Trichonephila clavata]